MAKDRNKEVQAEVTETKADEVKPVAAEPAKVAAEPAKVETKKKGMLFSRVSYPISVKYKGEESVISPNAKLNVDDVDALEKPLPKGLILRVIS